MAKHIGGHLEPLPRLFFPKVNGSKFEIAILFSIVEKPNKYVFGDDLLPHSPRRKGYKLQTLTSI